ncbi:ATP-binding protein [Chloroflexota bacterium]
MMDEYKTREQLLKELRNLRKRISELEALEKAYKRDEELLYFFRTNSPIGVFIIQDGKFVFANKEFGRATGIKANKLRGTSPAERVCPEDREMVRENGIKMLKGERTSPYRYRIISKDEQVRWMLEEVVSIQYQGRRAVFGHSLDITNRIEAEAKLRQLYENEKILRQNLEAEVQKRIEFTRALVHELKTPLTPVLFSSELLVSELHEEPWASIARNIHRGASNLNNRIEELLDLARVEIGSLQLDPKLVNSQRLLNNIADDIRALITKNRQCLVCDIPATLPEVWADPDRLRQVILNLLVNASKYTQEGSTITLAAREQGASLVIEVRDNGTGIPKADQQRLFQPYQRRRSDRERFSGLGLGLALSKNLVELHGGKIWVDSQTGKGSTFAFSIPLKSPVQTEANRLKGEGN